MLSVVAKVGLEHDGDSWHGWNPCDVGGERMTPDDPMVVVVHGVLRPLHLLGFVRHNVHAASRTAFHPGHRGSVDVSSALPFEHTSISMWESVKLARDYAYAPGGHSHAMKHARAADTHRVGCYLQVRPVASSGSLGLGEPVFPDLPEARRA